MITIVLVIYQIVITMLDILNVFLAFTLAAVYPIWKIFSPPKLKNLDNDVIMVTGSAKGLGRELALSFSQHGALIICVDKNEPLNNQTATDICKQGGSAKAFCCDISQHDQIKKLTEKIICQVGEIDILVNNAGIIKSKRMTECKTTDIKELFETNVYSKFWLILEWLPRMIHRGKGHIVTISSLAGEMGLPHLVPFTASKFAVNGMMEALSEEMRIRYHSPHVKLTTVTTGIIEPSTGPGKIIRFPSILTSVTYPKCAEEIVKKVRQNEELITVPERYFYMLKLFRFSPKIVQRSILKLLDSGVEEDGFNRKAI